MRLNLNSIVGKPGAKKEFRFSFNPEGLSFPQVARFDSPFPASGYVANVAGALELAGELETAITYLCDRCMTPVPRSETLSVTAHLAEELVDEENPDIFLVEDGAIDLDEVFNTAFVLSMDAKFVCSDDCKGLCTSCGANRNNETCACHRGVDPRLAALQQLLDKE